MIKKIEELKNKFIDAIKTVEKGLYGKIVVKEASYEEGYGVYMIFEYQIDDRIERMDSDVVAKIKEILGDQYGILLDRSDAFPSGYAAYTLVIDGE